MKQLGTLKVLWWGLMVEDGGRRGTAYYDSETIEQLRLFWTRLLAGWGVSDVQIGQDLMNPRLEWTNLDSQPGPVTQRLVRAQTRR